MMIAYTIAKLMTSATQQLDLLKSYFLQGFRTGWSAL